MTALRLVRPAQPSRTEALVEEFRTFGRACGWSSATLRTRVNMIKALARETGTEADAFTLSQMLDELARVESPWTRRTYYVTLRAWHRWLKAAGYRQDNPAEGLRSPRVSRAAPRPVRTEHLEAVLSSQHRLEAVAYITLAAYAGLRVHEIAKVRGEDLDLDAGTLRVVGKGGHEAVIPLHPRVARLARGWPERGWWFPSPTGTGHVHPNTVSTVIHRAFARIGVDATAHQLRHWFGTNVLRSSGGNLRVAQELLRHASPATTAIYTLVEDHERRAAIAKLPR